MPVKNALFCFAAAFIWGTAFVAQRVGGESIGPLTFNGLRFYLGFIVLLPAVLFRRSMAGKTGKPFPAFSKRP